MVLSMSDEIAPGDKIGIQSVEIGMRLLEAMVEHALDNPPPMLKTLAAKAGLPPAKAHRYMVSLVRAGLAERDPATDRYRLGATARFLGIRALQGMDVVRLATARLEAISERIEQSVALAIWNFQGPIIVSLHDHRGPITVSTRVGEIMPLTRSATGLVYCAWAPARVEPMLQKDLGNNRSAGRGPETMAALRLQIERTRADGYGRTEGGVNPTVNAVSVPLMKFGGELVGALAALGSADSFDVGSASLIVTELRAAAQSISGELGYYEGS
jgi:DNA-binding IclR family transcriptional regulator